MTKNGAKPNSSANFLKSELLSCRGLDRIDKGQAKLFDNLPKLMRPEQVASYFNMSIKTIYDWRYRGTLRGVPQKLFLSLNRRLFIRTDILVEWIASQNSGANLRK